MIFNTLKKFLSRIVDWFACFKVKIFLKKMQDALEILSLLGAVVSAFVLCWFLPQDLRQHKLTEIELRNLNAEPDIQLQAHTEVQDKKPAYILLHIIPVNMGNKTVSEWKVELNFDMSRVRDIEAQDWTKSSDELVSPFLKVFYQGLNKPLYKFDNSFLLVSNKGVVHGSLDDQAGSPIKIGLFDDVHSNGAEKVVLGFATVKAEDMYPKVYTIYYFSSSELVSFELVLV